MKRSSAFSGLIIPILVALFNVFLVLYPRDVISAAKEGLNLWFNNVFPSLLPFIIGTNILSGLGFVHFIGALLSPVMLPLFGVPGAGGFALITGLTSGYPMGARVTAFLREENQITQIQAQRLIAFCNNAGPLFIIGVVGTGLFGSVNAGYCLLLSHIFAALLIGLLFRFYKKGADKPPAPVRRPLRQAFRDMNSYRRKNNCAFGFVLGNSVKNAMESIALIGGFIIFFCVIVKILSVTGIIPAVRSVCNDFLSIPDDMLDGFLAGLLEVTNGAKIIATGSPTVDRARLTSAAALLSFGGFSIHAQTIHFIQSTDIKTLPYLSAKILHACAAALICSVISPYFDLDKIDTVPAVSIWENTFIRQFSGACFGFLLMMALLLAAAGLLRVVNILKYAIIRCKPANRHIGR